MQFNSQHKTTHDFPAYCFPGTLFRKRVGKNSLEVPRLHKFVLIIKGFLVFLIKHSFLARSGPRHDWWVSVEVFVQSKPFSAPGNHVTSNIRIYSLIPTDLSWPQRQTSLVLSSWLRWPYQPCDIQHQGYVGPSAKFRAVQISNHPQERPYIELSRWPVNVTVSELSDRSTRFGS